MTDATIPQDLVEYAAAIKGCRIEHEITQAALGYCKGRWAHDGTAAGHLRTLDRLCRELIREGA